MNELYILGGALVAAGAYIMYLHSAVRAYKYNVRVLTYILEQVEDHLQEVEDGKED